MSKSDDSRSIEQAASLQQTSAASDEITSITHATADASQEVARNMTETSGLVSDAKRKVGEMTQCMDAINASGAGVTAAIINTGSGASSYQLVISANATGTGQD